MESAPRLCHVVKVDGFDGYGFNLHAEQGKPGQYVGKVDAGSPAETAGLRRGDRILEVNGEGIAGEVHRQVVARIKAAEGQVSLLVTTPQPGERVPGLGAPEPRAPLNLGMTAAEMRAHLAARKRQDPKLAQMDLKHKFEIMKKL